MATDGKTLQFVPFCSALETGFWHQLAKNKLEVYGLDESPKTIHGFYFNGDAAGLPSRLSVDFTAFDSDHKTPAKCFPSTGTLINTNTIENFKTCDKQALINSVGQKIFDAIKSGQAIENPSLLSQFILLTHADLKKYHFYYWFAFPCLPFPEGVSLLAEPITAGERFTQDQLKSLLRSYDEIQADQANPYFVILEEQDSICITKLSSLLTYVNQSKKIILGFSDPCTVDNFPGWPLRNLLWLVAHHW